MIFVVLEAEFSTKRATESESKQTTTPTD